MIHEQLSLMLSEIEGAVARCDRALRPTPDEKDLQIAALNDRVRELEKAIGVCVPACLRVLLQQLPADAEADRELTTATLDRINKAMRTS